MEQFGIEFSSCHVGAFLRNDIECTTTTSFQYIQLVTPFERLRDIVVAICLQDVWAWWIELAFLCVVSVRDRILLTLSFLRYFGDKSFERFEVKCLPIAIFIFPFVISHRESTSISVWIIEEGGIFLGVVMVIDEYGRLVGFFIQCQRIRNLVFRSLRRLLVMTSNRLAGSIEEVLHHGIFQQL